MDRVLRHRLLALEEIALRFERGDLLVLLMDVDRGSDPALIAELDKLKILAVHLELLIKERPLRADSDKTEIGLNDRRSERDAHRLKIELARARHILGREMFARETTIKVELPADGQRDRKARRLDPPKRPLNDRGAQRVRVRSHNRKTRSPRLIGHRPSEPDTRERRRDIMALLKGALDQPLKDRIAEARIAKLDLG